MAIFNKYPWFLLLLFFALTLRVFIYTRIMNRTQNPDYYLYKEWVYKSYSYGINNVYSIHSPHGIRDVDQPPGTIYILRGSYEIFIYTTRVLTHYLHLAPGATIWIDDNLLIFFFRLPSIIADIILGSSIFIFLRNRVDKKIAFLCSAFYLLNPPIIYNSTVWGQMDSINNLFFYLSLVLLICKKQFFSLFFLALSLFTKISLLPLVPFYFLFVILGDNFSFRSFLKSIIEVIIIFIFLSIPFSSNPIWIFTTFYKVAQGIDQRITVNAYNFWWLILNPIRLATTQTFITSFLSININIWAYIIFSCVCAPLIFCTTKLSKYKKLSTEQIFHISFLAIFAAFLFLPKMHERYLYPIFPLFITWIGLKNKYWVSYFILSTFHFLNLYIVWNPDLFLFQEFEDIIKNQRTILLTCLGTLLIFFLYYLKIFNLSIYDNMFKKT